LREALNILRRQLSTQTTSWTASNVKNGVAGDDEVRQNELDPVSGDGGSGNPVLPGAEEDLVTKPVCDAWTQLPGMAGNPSEALSSVALAYQVSLLEKVFSSSLKKRPNKLERFSLIAKYLKERLEPTLV
jgi:hypothetical protein